MKYLKKFENENLKYKKDDYVFIVGYPEFDNISKICLSNSKPSKKRGWDYLVNTFYKITGESAVMYIDESDIDRKLTSEEIYEYEAKKDMTKYNL